MQSSSVRYDPQARFIVSARDIVYRRDGTREWLARIYEPQGPGPFPVLLEVHGGAWQNGDRLQNQAIDETLAASGLLVVAIDFHLSTEAPYPASVRDVNFAVRWLKAHAAEYNGDPATVGGSGFSSGGHLIMLSSMRPHDPRYTGIELPEAPDVDASLPYVIMGWPVIDPLSRYQFAQRTEKANLVAAGLTYFGDEAGMSEANPQQILERGESVQTPPALLVQGSADASLTPGMAERFVEAYCAAGGIIELGKYPGAPHGFVREEGANREAALEQIRFFIARQLSHIGA